MRTTFRARQPYADILLQAADDYVLQSPVRPERFIRLMKTNVGSVSGITGAGLDPDGLELKNPVIVALGDSVTAGHFESLLPTDSETIAAMIAQMNAAMAAAKEEPAPQDNDEADSTTKDSDTPTRPPVEITDARESYVEKFRMKLIDRFETTSVSIINAGIAGDVLTSMERRLDRDVISHHPDLVLINGSLNWSVELGTAEEYKEILRSMVRRIKQETTADIILLTPNGDVPNDLPFYVAMGTIPREPTTRERVEKIRELAEEERVCLADTYAVWEDARKRGCPWKELLANGVNHPGVEGHEVYARVLMKLFD